MDPKEYIKKYIENSSEYDISDEENKTIKHEGIGQFVFNKLNSTKYKASSTEIDYVQKIKDKIELCLMHDLPIHLSLPFGATKNPYINTAPNIDYAEVFNIGYIREYLKPIAKAYKHGVILDYVSVGVFEEKVNNIPLEDIRKYDMQFSNLLEIYKKNLPANLQINYKRVEDQISKAKIDELLDKKINQLRKTWRNQDAKTIEYKLFRARRNCKIDKDLDIKEQEKMILDAALGHDAFCSECWTIKPSIWDEKEIITLGHNYTSGWAIHVRSCNSSSVNFWSGKGILLEKNGEFSPTILSLSQYEKIQKEIIKEKIDYFKKPLEHLNVVEISRN